MQALGCGLQGDMIARTLIMREIRKACTNCRTSLSLSIHARLEILHKTWRICSDVLPVRWRHAVEVQFSSRCTPNILIEDFLEIGFISDL